jgi:hypothetical protein
MNMKNLLAYLLTLVVSVSLTACTDDCANDEGGAADCGGTDAGAGTTAGTTAGTDAGTDAGAGTTTEPTVYNTVIIMDMSSDINNDGTPGADILEVDFSCESDIDVSELGGELGSPVCDGSNGENCVCQETVAPTCTSGIDRSDFNTAYDGDYETYVSLGIEGSIGFLFTGDVNGCTVTVHEKQGTNTESYAVFACPETAEGPEDCIQVGEATDTEENSYTIDIAAN